MLAVDYFIYRRGYPDLLAHRDTLSESTEVRPGMSLYLGTDLRLTRGIAFFVEARGKSASDFDVLKGLVGAYFALRRRGAR